MKATVPNFQWENAQGGYNIKDFATMKRTIRNWTEDVFDLTANRRAFYDASNVFALQSMGTHGSDQVGNK